MQNWVFFVCSLDNFLLKNVIVSFLKINFKMVLIWKKKSYFWPTFHIFIHQGKDIKISSAHISVTYIHVFSSLYWFFTVTNFAKITNLSCMVSLWCDWCWFLFASFWFCYLLIAPKWCEKESTPGVTRKRTLDPWGNFAPSNDLPWRRPACMYACKWDMYWRNICVFSLVTKKCEK